MTVAGQAPGGRASKHWAMRRLGVLTFTLVLLAVGLGAPTSRATDPYVCQGPGACLVEDVVVPVPTAMGNLGTVDTHVNLLLPPGHGTGTSTYPVVYLLHGAGDTYRTWVDNTDVETFAGDQGAIIVMPDGGRSPDAGFYSDWFGENRKWETFHLDVLLPWVNTNLAAADQRAVMGLSMGGFGALSYAGRHPGLFDAAASFSGLLDTQMYGPAEGVGFKAVHEYFGTPDERVWGDAVTRQDKWAEHNPTALARAGALGGLDGNIWLTTGTGTPGGPQGDDPANPGGYGVEQFIWQTNQSFKRALDDADVAYRDYSYVGGLHDWPYWEAALHRVLPEVVDAISGG